MMNIRPGRILSRDGHHGLSLGGDAHAIRGRFGTCEGPAATSELLKLLGGGVYLFILYIYTYIYRVPL